MTDKDVPRRALIKAGAWAVPVVTVAVATPLAAASGGGALWTITDIVAAYRLDAAPGEYRLEVSFTLARANGGPLDGTGAGGVTLLAEGVRFFPFPDATVMYVSTTFGPPATLQAQQFYLEIGPRGSIGPFPIDRSALGE